MKTFDIKKAIQENEFGNRELWSNFKFEVNYSNNGVARIYINDRKTKYSAGGYGYDKESSVIAQMINDLTIPTKYKKGIYGHRNGYLSQGGVGFSSIEQSFNSKRGNSLKKIYSGHENDIFEIKINLKYLIQ